MTRLLVSVRSGVEAVSALAGGAEVIDIKEPSRGALGAAHPSVWHDVCCRVHDRCPVSAALGELLSDGPFDRLGSLQTIRQVKIGLAACRDVHDWPARWRQIVERLPDSVAAVAVVYADHDRAASPSPEAVLSCATHSRCSAVLIDTFDKSHGGLFDIMPVSRVGEILQAARDVAPSVVLGGSLNQNSLPAALALRPDLIAVRGAACHRNRSGSIEQARVRGLAEMLASARRRES